jgi:hypothetical protein
MHALGLILCLSLVALAGWAADPHPLDPAPAWAGSLQASAAQQPAAIPQAIPAAPQQTPIIDPLPVLRPAFLPFALRGYNPQLPEPLSSTVRGYVAELRALGRERCAPATHVLLDKPEGVLGAAAIGVLHARRPGPNLDLYAGEFVEVGGTTSLAPTPCLILTEWLIEARTVKVIDLPPGQSDLPPGQAD